MAIISSLEKNSEWFNCIEERDKVEAASYLAGFMSMSSVFDVMYVRTNLRRLGMPNEEVMKLRDEMLSMDDLGKLKYAIFDAAISNNTNIKYHMKKNGLDLSDHEVAVALIKRETLLPFKKQLAKNKVSTIPHPDRIEREVDRASKSPELTAWINRFVYKKLRAFYKSERLSQEDYVNDLKFHFIRTYKLYRPIRSEEFAYNSSKRVVHNEGIKKIAYHLDPSRRRIYKNNTTATGYDNVLMSITIKAKDGSGTEIFSPEVEKNSGSNEYERLDFLKSIKQVQSLFTGKRLEALKILCLEDNQKFVAWYNKAFEEDIYSVKEAFFESEDWLNVVAKYFGAKQEHMDLLLQQIRNAISK